MRIPRAHLVAGSCRTEAKGYAFAAKYAAAWYCDTAEMLDREKPDVAIIATPSGAHLPALLACAERKIHVICEKPLEITPARVREMIDAADRAGIRLGAIFPQRFNPTNLAVHAAARAGRFGSLAAVQGTVPWWRDDAYYAPNRWQGKIALDGGGALMNQAVHTVDLLQWFAAATMPDLVREANPVQEVFAITAQRGHEPALIEVEDTAVVAMKFRNGAVGQLLAATSMFPGMKRHIHIGGRDGSAEIFEEQLITFQFRVELPEDESTRHALSPATRHGAGAADPLAISDENHRRNLEDFFDALANDRPPALDGIEGAKAVDIVDAAYHSARSGRAVILGPA
jgi:predicted dehydrogenase